MRELWLKIVGITLLIVGAIVIVISIFGMNIISAPDYYEQDFMKRFYAFWVLFGIGMGIFHGFLGYNLLRLKQFALYITLILSAIITLIVCWVFLKTGTLFFPFNAIFFIYLLIFIVLLLFVKEKKV